MTPAQQRLLDLQTERGRVHTELLDALRVQYDEPIEALRTELATHCNHPTEFVAEFSWTWRSGYGRHEQRKGWHCSICGRDKHWEHSQNWSLPGDRSRDD